jgi:DNA-binding transcriptional MocR family regulator
MYDMIVRALLLGVPGGSGPWGKLPKVKFLCPSPGYDRHFAICNQLGIEMITIELRANGPDMDQIERLVAEDEAIKGIWLVPKYSNPTGITFSDEVVDRFAKMKTKAPDFRIFWDNAYAMHHFTEQPDHLKNILDACKKAGNPDRVFLFSSTSKISFAGAGLSLMAASENNINWIKKQMIIQTIGPDKLNQLRHVRFFKDFAGIEGQMKKHAAILKPKFNQVYETLESELGGKKITEWTKPNGGYFISLNTLEGCAKKVVTMAAEAGVVLTGAGATYPYGNDPLDRNIRIAPSFPTLAELKKAMEIVAVCIQLASIEKILDNK